VGDCDNRPVGTFAIGLVTGRFDDGRSSINGKPLEIAFSVNGKYTGSIGSHIARRPNRIFVQSAVNLSFPQYFLPLHFTTSKACTHSAVEIRLPSGNTSEVLLTPSLNSSLE
jgi:hypothetical protein